MEAINGSRAHGHLGWSVVSQDTWAPGMVCGFAGHMGTWDGLWVCRGTWALRRPWLAWLRVAGNSAGKAHPRQRSGETEREAKQPRGGEGRCHGPNPAKDH
jgi:hypothetical protein